MVPTKAFIVLAALAAVALGGAVRRDAEKSGSHEHHGPSFMEGLDDATKDKFHAIFWDRSLKGEAKDAALLNLATASLTPEKLAEFKSHQEEWKQRRAQWKANYEAKYAKLSPKAKKAADEIKALWENDNMNRAAKKAKKEEIFKSLTEAERKEVEGLHPHNRHHFEPKFMRDLPQETKDKFKAIWRDHSLKGEAKDAALTKLAQSTLTPQQLTEFKEDMAKMAEWRKEMEAKLAKLSPNARKAADEIHAVWENEDLDWKEKKEKMEAIKAGLTDAEKAELKTLHGGRRGHHGGRRGPHGKGGKSSSESKEQ
uniref:SXP/RAL-2 family protein Ani s 5-like cation-binding domain-containing protein n=1 Tax=Plectus sambesii TaxID=2011161 RepID=A0A914XFU1_9BILA